MRVLTLVALCAVAADADSRLDGDWGFARFLGGRLLYRVTGALRAGGFADDVAKGLEDKHPAARVAFALTLGAFLIAAP